MNARMFLLGGLFFLSTACQKSIDEVLTEVTLETQEIVLPENTGGGEQLTTASFTTTAPWRIELSDSKSVGDWVHVSPLSGEAGTVTLTIAVDENRTPTERKANIRLLSGSEERNIVVTQPGDGSLPAGESIYRTGVVQDTLVIRLPVGRTYRTDVEQGDDWLGTPRLSSGERFDSLSFVLPTNRSMEERVATVRVSDANGDYTALLTIVQPSAALDITLSLPHVELPTGGVGGEAPEELVDSLFVAGFDAEGRLLFTQDLPQTYREAYAFRVLPTELLLRDYYPSARIYVVANSASALTGFSGNEQEFVNRKDTAISRLFGAGNIQPPLSGMTIQDLTFGPNRVAVGLSHVTAQVTFKVLFDSTWTASRTLEQVNIGGFSTWGYLFATASDTQTSPIERTFSPAVEPTPDNQYRFFAYENSQLVLTVRAGGRYYQGSAPNVLKRGYKYSFNMRLADAAAAAASSAQASTVPNGAVQEIVLRPL